MKLTQTRIRAGVWEGVLSGAAAEAPKLEVLHLEKPLAGRHGHGRARAARATVRCGCRSRPRLLSEGVQTFLIRVAAARRWRISP